MSKKAIYYVNIGNFTKKTAKKIIKNELKSFKKAFPKVKVLAVPLRGEHDRSYVEVLPF